MDAVIIIQFQKPEASSRKSSVHQGVPRRRYSVLHQHADGHGAHASRNGSDERCLLLHACTSNNRRQSRSTSWDLWLRSQGPGGSWDFCPHSPSKSTSPMSRTFPVLGSWTRLMPTSMTAAPSLTISAVISPGTPTHR